jgi:hypothetical protein
VRLRGWRITRCEHLRSKGRDEDDYQADEVTKHRHWLERQDASIKEERFWNESEKLCTGCCPMLEK